MTTVIVAMFIALALALVVVALVAVPARRAGRDLLTPQGEQLVQNARERTAEAAGAARDKTVEVAEAARGRVTDRRPAEPKDVEPTPAQVDIREQRARAHD